MSPSISIGVAVYNVKAYLVACLDSILRHASEEIEVLVVDDASCDGSGNLCDSYAKRSPFIRVIHFPYNCGICAVRNTILREATGKWLFFVDGDDLLPEEFSAVAKSLLHLPYDLIFFDYISCQEQVFQYTASIGQPVIELSPQVLEAYCISCATGAPCRLADARLHSVRYTSVWAKAYRRAFLLEQNLWFPEKQEKSQDVLFNTLVYHACRSAAYIPVVMYGYRKHPNSVCNRYHSDFLPGMEQLMERNLAHITEFFPGREDLLDDFLHYRVAGILLDTMRLSIFHPDNPMRYHQRRQVFHALLEYPRFSECLANLDLTCYWLERQFLLNCARKRRFFLLTLAYRYPWILKGYGGIMHRKKYWKAKWMWGYHANETGQYYRPHL